MYVSYVMKSVDGVEALLPDVCNVDELSFCWICMRNAWKNISPMAIVQFVFLLLMIIVAMLTTAQINNAVVHARDTFISVCIVQIGLLNGI